MPILLALAIPAPGMVASPTSEAPAPPASGTTDPTPAPGEEAEPAPSDAPVVEEEPEPDRARAAERVRVVGSTDRAREATGSAEFIGREELRKQGHSDVQRILRSVPGVNLQDEDGYGLRPNIGMRGTGVERSQKVTLMEDGVLIAPAPYAAPSAYYFPTAGRMEGFEISKGPSSIRQGPHTTGGVLNMLSRSIPTRLSGLAELTAGADAYVRGRLALGNSTDRFGWLVESFRQETDGFKSLDGGGSTGFDLTDYLAKLRVNSAEGAPHFQSLELKLGRTDQFGDETYLGLARADFDRTPYRRYAASSEDFIDTRHEQLQLRYFVVPDPKIDLTTTVYLNDFYRNWHKLQSVGGEGIGGILADPSAPTFDGLLDIIRGDVDSAPGDLQVRNNRRNYFSRGIQSVVGLRIGPRRARHEIEIGLRYHEDEEDRFQEEDAYQMVGGSMQRTALGQPGSQSNRISNARALAFFVRDEISLGRWRLEPGVRVESVDFERDDYGKNDPTRSGVDLVVKRNDVDAVIPGVGAAFTVTPRFELFGGIHEGFAPPGPGQDDATEPEESVNHELGGRFASGATHFQAVAFFNDYDNLLGTDTASSGGEGSGDQFNGGEVRVHGLELAVDGDLRANAASAGSVPFRVAYTYTHGEFRNDFETSFADWAPAVRRGDELPYLPAHQLFAEAGWRGERWAVFVGGSYVSEMRTHAGQGVIPRNESIESHVVLDASGEYRLPRLARFFVRVRNLADEIYVAARRPAGLRPGMPRTVLAGFALDF